MLENRRIMSNFVSCGNCCFQGVNNMTNPAVEEVNTVNMEKAITRILHLLGIPAHVKGYRYLRDAIIMAIGDYNAADLITKYIYPDIARAYHTTPFGVERAMRHALQLAWERGFDGPVTDLIFPIRASKPKNSEFICEVANYIQRTAL